MPLDFNELKIVAYSGWKQPADAFPIFKKIISLTGKKRPKVVYVATGGKDREVTVPKDVYYVFDKLGAKVTEKSICVTKQPAKAVKEALADADIVYVGGGDMKFLMNHWRKSYAINYILAAGERGAVLCGASTGAMCWAMMGFDDYGKHIQLRFSNKFPFVKINGGFEFITGIGLLPFGICPHYETAFWSKFDKYADRTAIPFYALENNTAICLSNGHLEIIKGNNEAKAYLFDNGKGIFKKEVNGEIYWGNEE